MTDVVLTRREMLETAGWLGAGAVALAGQAAGRWRIRGKRQYAGQRLAESQTGVKDDSPSL